MNKDVESEIKRILIKLAGPSRIKEWFDKSCPMFDGRTPRWMIDNGKGQEVLYALSNLHCSESTLSGRPEITARVSQTSEP